MVGCVLIAVCGQAQVSTFAGAGTGGPGYRTDRILVRPRAVSAEPALAQFHARHKSRVIGTFEHLGHLQIVAVPEGETVDSLVAEFRQSGLVQYAEPDYLVYPAAVPNDPKFQDGTLWALENYGQNGGTAHADIGATNAWDILTSASNIVVAVVDSGMQVTHEDLAGNMWVNPANGGHGFNAFDSSTNVPDDTGHGSLVGGVLGAVGNNGVGITGVAWRVQMMACKALSGGSGSASTVIACFEYARTNGARIINASLSSTTFSTATRDEIAALRDAGIILVASAGNGTSVGANVDVNPTYPACYNLDNIISVAYTTRNDTLGQLSNYGATNVLLAAPGDQIYSTFSGSDSAYYPPSSLPINLAGTSFAAPYVAGACALLMAQYPADGYKDTIARLVSATDPLPSLAGKCRTGGRLDLAKAIRSIRLAAVTNSGPFELSVSGGLNRTCAVEYSTNLIGWTPVFTNSTTTNGIFQFSDAAAGGDARRFYRATASQ